MWPQKGANPVPPPKGGRLGSLSMVLPIDKKSLPPGSGNGKPFRHTRFLNFDICERRVTSLMHSSMNPFVASATCCAATLSMYRIFQRFGIKLKSRNSKGAEFTLIQQILRREEIFSTCSKMPQRNHYWWSAISTIGRICFKLVTRLLQSWFLYFNDEKSNGSLSRVEAMTLIMSAQS